MVLGSTMNFTQNGQVKFPSVRSLVFSKQILIIIITLDNKHRLLCGLIQLIIYSRKYC